MSKTASLTSGLVAKKGQASPAVIAASVVPPASADRTEPKSAAADYYKALTVKLDRDRYESLKNVGVKLDKKSQEIFVEALDLWLRQANVQSN